MTGAGLGMLKYLWLDETGFREEFRSDPPTFTELQQKVGDERDSYVEYARYYFPDPTITFACDEDGHPKGLDLVGWIGDYPLVGAIFFFAQSHPNSEQIMGLTDNQISIIKEYATAK